jgi:hypothetical protein
VRAWWIVASVFLCSSQLYADTVQLKDGNELKGLIVEKHEDRIILNTEKGETPVLKNTIQNISYDDPEQNFMQIGEAHEAARHFGEALAYYERALEANPNFDDAKKATVRVRNRVWSRALAAPKNEIERRQTLYDLWDQGGPSESFAKKETRAPKTLLREGLGVELECQGDWVRLAQVFPKKDAASAAGLKKNDRLAAMDGMSMRYLSPDVVQDKLLYPRYSNFSLEFERDCALMKTGFEREFSEFGLDLKLEYQGVVVQSVKKGSLADKAGLKGQDLLVAVNGNSIRYLPLAKLMPVIAGAKNDTVILSVRRSVILTRR